jgi:hypothetical protein
MYVHIRYLDEKYDHTWERCFIEEFCGLDYKKYQINKGILTMEILERNLDKIILHLKGLELTIKNPPKFGWCVASWEDLAVGYQILGLLILETKSYMPKYVRDVIMKVSTWEFDKKRGWSSVLIEKRKQYLKEFRDGIKNYSYGDP